MHRADVARLVQARRVREVRDHERDDMAGRGERPCVDPVLVGEFLERPLRKVLDDLLQDGVYSPACCLGFGFHKELVLYTRKADQDNAFCFCQAVLRRRRKPTVAREHHAGIARRLDDLAC